MYDEHSFYSIDRLVEFGMTMAVSQQMVNSMNNMMTNMHIPGVMNPMRSGTQQQSPQIFYAMIDGKQSGPFSETECTRLIADKKIVKETYVWAPGMKDWQLAETTPSLLKLVALTPPEFKSK